MKRPLVTDDEWEMEPFILDIITPYIGETVLTSTDFVAWHCTCKTVWRHLDPLLYSAYMHLFLIDCFRRNIQLYTQTPHTIIYRRLAVLTTLIRVCRLVPNLVSLMKTKVVLFDYAPIIITGDLSQHGREAPNLSRTQDIDMINITYHYIKEKFGWSFVLFNNVNLKDHPKMPLTPPILLCTHEYSMALIPCLYNTFTTKENVSLNK